MVPRTSGFTLIEMLIGIVIMGIAISMVSVAVSQSVRNQERMQHLLDLYQVALTSTPLVIEQLNNNQLTGSTQTGNIEISWHAELLEQRSEAPVFMAEFAQYTQPSFIIRYYAVTTTIQSPHARRVYQFEHMLEQHKSETALGF